VYRKKRPKLKSGSSFIDDIQSLGCSGSACELTLIKQAFISLAKRISPD
jgi:hypothetical protein